jgi:hypothetical protein
MISDSPFLAESPNGLAAGPLLGDQVAPKLALLVGHPPKMPHLQRAAKGGITRRLPNAAFSPARAMPEVKNLHKVRIFMNAVVNQNRRMDEFADTGTIGRRTADQGKTL